MNIIEIDSASDRRVSMFASLTEAQLRQSSATPRGLFIAESPKVIRVALDEGYSPVALLCERRHIDGDAADIIAKCADMPVYTGSREVLASLTGYTLTRGVLCAMQRPEPVSPADVCREARLVAVIDSVSDTTNIGAIFRSAAALGVDGILLSPGSCDPLNRRSIRVSMGTVFKIPWAWLPENDYVDCLKSLGLITVAFALTDASLPLDSPVLEKLSPLALIFGTEGDGLPGRIIAECDYTVRIPMSYGVDSLNVAAASAVAFWHLRKR